MYIYVKPSCCIPERYTILNCQLYLNKTGKKNTLFVPFTKNSDKAVLESLLKTTVTVIKRITQKQVKTTILY